MYAKSSVFDAFGIKAGEKMWLDPADRAIIW